MQRGINLQELAARLETNRNAKRDMIVEPNTDLKMELVEHTREPQILVRDQGTYGIRPTGHDQIGSYLKIPATYYDRMLADEPDLLVTNVNRWFSRTTKPRMLRTLDGKARAFLSNRYQRIENEEIAEVALPVLYDIPDVKIVSLEVTERRLYIQAVAPRVEGEVKVGDVVQAGVIISNSEIGYGAVTVDPLVFRLICSNGMVIKDGGFRKYHIGRRIEDNAELWAEDTVRADDRTVLLKTRDMIRSAVDAVRFRERIEQMRGLTEARVTGDPARVVEVLAQKVGANDEERGGILRALIEGANLSAWGLVNAVTAQAHNAKGYDRGVEFEEMGGVLINLPANDWKEILKAA